MKKSVLLSLVLSSFIYGYVNPLSIANKATENGGTLSAIDAYQDGVGAMVVENGRGIDNSAMNNLVFKYGTTAKSNTLSLPDQVLLTGSAEDKLLVGSFFSDGTSCSIINKTGSTYLNGICQGGTWTNNGTSCNDNNSGTTGETWLNGICQGGILVNVAGNGLIYDNCEGGSRNWTNAGTYCASKGMRLPAYNETSYSLGLINGIPGCGSLTWTGNTTGLYNFYYLWSGTSSANSLATNSYAVRCVK